jgi:hypothetical protein
MSNRALIVAQHESGLDHISQGCVTLTAKKDLQRYAKPWFGALKNRSVLIENLKYFAVFWFASEPKVF